MKYLKLFRQVKNFIFDVDGIFTDGTISVEENGDMVRVMNVRDGYAVKIATRLGYHISAITGGSSLGVKSRLLALGMQEVYLGASDKLPVYQEHVRKYNLDPTTILYMGDDLPDYPVMQEIGVPCCPMDAVDEVRDTVIYISPKGGGEGCVRDVIEKVLKLQGQWPGYPKLKQNPE